jgi:hypothetical protein
VVAALKELDWNVEYSKHEESAGDELDDSASEDGEREIWTIVDNVSRNGDAGIGDTVEDTADATMDNIDRNLAAGIGDTVEDTADATVDNVDRNLAAENGDTVGDIADATVDNVNQILAAGNDDTGEDSGDAVGNSDDDVNEGSTVGVVDMGSGDSGNNEDGDEVTVTVVPVRRSTRTTKGRNSNPNRLPQTAVQQEAVVVARAMRPSFQDFSQVVLNLQQQTLNLQQQTLNLQQQTFSQTVQVLKDYCGDCE